MDINDCVIPRILENRLALVTGAGQGIGAIIARGLARAGAAVIAIDINPQTVEQTATAINQDGGQAWSFALDVASDAACTSVAQEVRSTIGEVDLLVNAAGILIRDTIDSEHVATNLERSLQVNVLGTLNVTRAWLSSLRAKRGTVVNFASIASYASRGGPISYTPSKGAVKMLTQSLASELAADGVRVNAIAPGPIATPMIGNTRQAPDRLKSILERVPMARVGEPEEIVGAAIFLSSDMSTYVTGAILPVDGGFLAR